MISNAAKTIRETIENKSLIRGSGHVIVGLSGGPDSMCLFHVLYNMRKELGIELSAVHLNHKFRPGYAEEDQKFVEELLDDLDVYCYSKTVDVNEAAASRGETPEEAGRNERYKAFDEEAIRVHDSGVPKEKIFIVVAQNQNDCVETILMRIFRGTGIDGLSGIPYKRKSSAGFDIIRPLLDVEREDIEEYCDSHMLNPRRDHTNTETNYNRNRIRLDLLPKLKSEYNYNVEGALLRLSSLASTDKDYFDETVNQFLSRECELEIDSQGASVSARIKTDSLNELHPALSHRAIISILKELGLEQGLEALHVDAAMNTINRNQTGKIIEFPDGYRMRISYGDTLFFREQGTVLNNPEYDQDYKVQIDLGDIKKTNDEKEVVLPSGMFTLRLLPKAINSGGKYIMDLDFKEIVKAGNNLEFRYRKSGDRISVKGMNGTKKIQDLFIDEKIPRDKRDHIPLVICGGDILWVAGVKKSDKYLISESTKDSLSLEWKPNN